MAYNQSNTQVPSNNLNSAGQRRLSIWTGLPAVALLVVSQLAGTAHCQAQSGSDQGAEWTLWWQHTNGTVACWTMNGANRAGGSLLHPDNVGPDWKVAGVGDFTGDGQEDDLLFEHPNGAVAAWCMNGTNCTQATYLSPSSIDPQWQFKGSCDLNQDGSRELLLQRADGLVGYWQMDTTNRTAAVLLNPSRVGSWQIQGAGDLNGDGQSDILLQHPTGAVGFWRMQGATSVQSGYLNPSRVDPKWKIVGTVDLNGDGRSEILWRHDSGTMGYWVMNGTNRVSAAPLDRGSVDPAWKIVGPR